MEQLEPQIEERLDPDLEERLKSLKGISCHACLDTGFQHEFVLGEWHIKYETTNEEVTEGKKNIRLMKCDHGIDRGY